MKDNVALIGMSGTLKTAIAKKLSVLLDKRCVDTDELIEYELSMSIKDLFEKMGEEYFRRTEEKTVCQVSDFYNIVVSTGGGVVLSEKSMDFPYMIRISEKMRKYCIYYKFQKSIQFL